AGRGKDQPMKNIRSPFWRFRAARLVAICFFVLQMEPSSELRADDLFNSTNLIRLELVFAQLEFQQIQEAWRMRGRGDRTKVPVVVREGGRAYSNVLAQLKGGGTFRPISG